MLDLAARSEKLTIVQLGLMWVAEMRDKVAHFWSGIQVFSPDSI